MKLMTCMVASVIAFVAIAGADWPVVKSYEGENLRRVKMPLGGIGTGTISLSGRGGLVDWEIFNEPAKGFVPSTSHRWPPHFNPSFALRCETADGARKAILLEGPLSTAEYEGEQGATVANSGFPRFGKAVFKAAYPLAQVELSEGEMPVEVALEAMNPLVIGDAFRSGMPAILLRWRLKNTTDKAVKASIAGTMINCCGQSPQFAKKLMPTIRREERIEKDGLKGIRLYGRRAAAKEAATNETKLVSSADGEFGLFVPEEIGKVTTAVDMREPGWGVGMDRFWARFTESGEVADTDEGDTTAKRKLSLAQLAVAFELAPGEEKVVPFVLSWRFPNRFGWDWRREGEDAGKVLGNWYAQRFTSAADAAVALWRDLPALEAATIGFVKGVLAKKAPGVVKEAALFNVSTLRTETCFRTADGNFYGWEGCHDDCGSCIGSCTHVWGYEHCLVDLWPELARTMLDNAFGVQLAENGHMRFRVMLPLAANRKGLGVACADGQMQSIVKAYEYWKKSGDDEWMRRIYPAVRRALSFCWVEGGWDGDGDGVMEGCQHNTMDVEYYGPNPQMEFLYLAALAATEKMAEFAGEGEFAARCRALRERGGEWTEKNLFNGAYYEQRIMPPKGKVADGLRDPHMGAKDLSNPDYQLGAGCLVDQLLGDFAARAVGLEPVVDRAHARTALGTIVEKCRQTGGAVFNPMRSYTVADEVALRMAWYPADRLPRSPFPYYRENMTGFEYVVAALLAWEGNPAEAEQVVRDIRERYDGMKRNPFDEAECGHHYARALAAWTVLKAFDR